ncbi:hypothetical protein BO78DRAFT_117415 [Aspergillus sclerotiicarbonarius CBS 121057]|uniref:Uncharacterized protein n=1 Tax=Aspergillus sclerotiicarbonarius (strain CBS 121057 / IBT 28362) TaxID=1448318 RepID=A0A319E8C1_ASPSB|nr:hypothetical protein BO78DRAFT_117415 [Aspergillus sclerotiicarbonarius CBS 121057]
MSGCESPPANLRRKKPSQILHGLAPKPLTGLLQLPAPCRYPPRTSCPFLCLPTSQLPPRDPVRLQLLRLKFGFLSRHCCGTSSLRHWPHHHPALEPRKAPCDPEIFSGQPRIEISSSLEQS